MPQLGLKMVRRTPFHGLSARDLLRRPLNELPLDLAQSPVLKGIQLLKDELRDQGLRFTPKVWVSTDWFCPSGSRGFALPFYLLDSRLQDLEARMMGRCEGRAFSQLMQLLRHECGHALDNAFALRRNPLRSKLFGKSSMPYPDHYLPDPLSNAFVHHLGDHYAQAHPDEDWAETFATWLRHPQHWQRRYQGTLAWEKLQFVHHSMKNLRGKSPQYGHLRTVDSIETQTQTLEEYYEKKRRSFRLDTRQQFFDDLRPIFSVKRGVSAAGLLRQNRKDLADHLRARIKIRPYVAERLVEELIASCREQNWRLPARNSHKLQLLSQILASKSLLFQQSRRHFVIM